MTVAERRDTERTDPPALRSALALLKRGLWPIPITAPDDPVRNPGKQPIGDAWGQTRHTEETLRALYLANPRAGVGLKLGKDGGIIDIEVDDPQAGEATLERLFGGEILNTAGWDSARGRHLLFRWTPRLSRYKAILKGDWLPGLEIRIGANESGGKQYQSVCPPSATDSGRSRHWNGHAEIRELPEAFFAYLDANLPRARNRSKSTRPRILKFSGPIPPGSWDAEAVSEAIRDRFLDLAREWGIRLTGKVFDGDWAECHAIDREDKVPSAGLNLQSGVYHDFGSEAPALSFFNLAIALGAYPDFPTAVNVLGHRFGVEPVRKESGEFCDSAILLPNNNFSPDEEWELLRLWEPLPPEPFPLEAFPAPLADLCREASEAMQCPPDYFGGAALALAGAAMGLSVSVAIKPTWVEAPNLYLAIVGPPGSKKTPALKLMSRPLYRIDADLRDQYRREATQHEEDRREYEASRRKGTAEAPPVAPVPIQITMDDVTREALAHIHSENPRGLAVIMDELTAWVASLDAYRGGKGADKQFWLKANSGSLVKVSRRGTREAIVIPHPCITVVGGLTPGMLPGIRSDDKDDGWLDRILFAYPDPAYRIKRWVEREIPPDLIDDWCAAVRRLWDRPMVVDEGRPRPYIIHLTEEAHALWVEWFNRHNAEQEDPEFPAHLRGPWSKLEGFTGRMALILSQLHQAYDPTDTGPPRGVEPLDVWGAAKLAHYFKVHFRRARADLSRRPGDESEEAKAILRWIKLARSESFSGRDVSRQFHRFEEHERTRALAWLCSRNVIRQRAPDPSEVKKVGRKHSLIYDVNPEILDPDQS